MDKQTILSEAQETWDQLSYEQKEAAATIIFNAIDSLLDTPRSFRGLIYDVLGFDLESYGILYMAGGMNITNHLGRESE